jgi:hypothetical protein
MSERRLLIAWIALPLLFLVVLFWELNKWRSVVSQGRRAKTELSRLTAQIRAQEAETQREILAHSELLREMKWSPDRSDPSAFLTGLAEWGQGGQVKITAIAPLEQQATPQFSKVWHTVRVVAPYRELRELATRIEQEGGILEEVLLESPKEAAGPAAAARGEIQARFKLTTLELAAETKGILQRVAGRMPGKPEPSLALPLPVKGQEAALAGRDPFAFVVTTPPPRPVRVAAGPTTPAPDAPGPPGTPAPPSEKAAPKPLAPMDVKGIMGFPGGYLAIVNNQIVRVGDLVDGHRVERITDAEVVLRQPDGSPRSVTLPAISAVRPAAPRR